VWAASSERCGSSIEQGGGWPTGLVDVFPNGLVDGSELTGMPLETTKWDLGNRLERKGDSS
jgi:hypothetical protein